MFSPQNDLPTTWQLEELEINSFSLNCAIVQGKRNYNLIRELIEAGALPNEDTLNCALLFGNSAIITKISHLHAKPNQDTSYCLPGAKQVVRKNAIKDMLADEYCSSKIKRKPTFPFRQFNLSKEDPIFVKEYLLNAKEKDFLAMIIDSDDIAQFVLNDADLINRLNNIHVPTHHQTYPNSCAATAIMLLRNKLNPACEVTKKKELETYRSIWKKAGDEASLAAIANYLNRHHVAFDIFHDSRHAEQLIKTNPNFFNSIYKNEIKKNWKKLNIKELDIAKICTESGKYFILIFSSDDGFHSKILHYKNGQYRLTDPQPDTDKIIGNNLEEILNRDCLKYTGIAILISNEKYQQESQIKYSTIEKIISSIPFAEMTKIAESLPKNTFWPTLKI